MIKIDLKFMLNCVKKRKSAQKCKTCNGRGRIVKPTINFGECNGYSQDCPDCGMSYKLPRQWNLLTCEEIIDLFPLDYSKADKKAILEQFYQTQLLNDDKFNQLVKKLI